MAKTASPSEMTGDFIAKDNHAGGICFLCEKKIQEGDDIRYYGGPYIMHSACVDKLIDPHGAAK